MSNRVGNRERPSIPEPAGLGAEHAWLGVSVATFAAAVVTLYVDYATTVEVQTGTYPVLSAMFAAGAVGWLVGAAERRLRIELGTVDRSELRDTLTELHDKVDGLAKRVEELTDLTEQRSQVSGDRQGGGRPARGAVSAGGRAGRVAGATGGVDYWAVYTDVLEDLGGIEDRPSES